MPIFKTIFLAALSGVLLVGCATNQAGYQQQGQQGSTNRTAIGAALGAATGAVIGSVTNKSGGSDRRKAAVIGAGIGALGGGVIGNYMDRQETALRQELVNTGVQVQRQGDNILLNMPNSITFGFDQSDVRPEFYAVIKNISAVLNNYPSTFVDVVGHTDSIGTASYNEQLSMKRAQAVADLMIRDGVISDRLVVRGLGEALPLATNDTAEGRARNRRVEILISPIREGLNG